MCSFDKYEVIFVVVVCVFVEDGVSVMIVCIVKFVGVVEGMVFIYFEIKDVLLNVLYLSLKVDLCDVMMIGFLEYVLVE